MSRLCLFLLFFLFIFTAPALAIDCDSGFNSLASGISYKKIVTDTPRALTIHVAKVNLQEPGIGLFVTPKNSVVSTTSDFLNNFNLQLAINANPFTSATLNGLSGFAASQGDLYKTTNLPTPSLIATKNNSIQFKDLQDAAKDTPSFWNIISGFNLLTENGQPASPEIIKCSDPQYAQANPGYCTSLAPRTAIGLSNNNQLILMVVDGRQNQSLGANLPELQELMLACRANNSLNLDGGSDSTLVAKGQGILNSPSAGEQTVVTHLGICLNNCADLSKSTPQATLPPSSLFPPSTPPLDSTADLIVPQAYSFRPFPNQLVEEEKNKAFDPNNPNLAPFCAYRPTVAQASIIDKRFPMITLISGTLTTNFSSFITPFLSAPGSSAGNKRYLADYLEGAAYYLTTPEPNDLTQVFDHLGVFRKLAPQSYQDQLKRALIQRASGSFSTSNNPYGFPPATNEVHNYLVANLSGNKVYLKDFINNWAPLPDDFTDDKAYQTAYENWKTKDAGKWFKLWPYVPMFTREDTKGFIEAIPEPGQIVSKKVSEVIHPHLARTYEVSSMVANMLSPASTHQFQLPNLPVSWVTPAPWTTDSNWLNSSKAVPAGMGPVCDPQAPTKVIAGSGDLAKDGEIITTVLTGQITNPYFDQNCERKYLDPETKKWVTDDSACYIDSQYRFSPIYLKTYTPFLDQIAFNLLTGPGALFGIFNPTNEKPENWPAVGNDSQKAPAYSFSTFSNGRAESGLKKAGKPAQYLYNYLGSLHCQKEKLISMLQPFITGQGYNIPPECTGGPIISSTTSPDTTNPLGTWLQWPSANKTPGYYTSCYGKRCWINDDGSLHFGNHAGIDIAYGDGAGIYAAAPGIVHAADSDSVFGYHVIIDHQNGWYTIYGHMQPNLLVSTGDTVDTSTQLGYQDSSGDVYPPPTSSCPACGTHLHFGLSQGGNTTDFFMASGLTIDVCSALPNCTCNPNQYNGLDHCPAGN